MASIFISHSSKDSATADEIKRWLEAAPRNHSVFLDCDPEAGIKGGKDWEQTLYQRLRTCRVVIPLLTRDWLASKWCFAEIVHARSNGKTIVPLKVAACDALEIFPATQQIDLTRNTADGYQRLELALREVFSWNESRPPYPGLLAFQENDAAIFFGRGPEVSAAVEKLESMRRRGAAGPKFLLVLGASGSGKSSLVRAGVIPRLRNRDGWLALPALRPREDPLSELAAAIAQTYERWHKPRDYNEIYDKLHGAGAKAPPDEGPLTRITRDLTIKAQRSDATVLLVVDQAEELFGESRGEPADRFLRLLRAALESANGRMMALATMRSEFLGAFQTHPFLLDPAYPDVFEYQEITVDPLPVDRFTEIIRGPADLVSLVVDDDLVERMVKDTGTRDALPLLAYTLRRLWDNEACRAEGRFRLRDYEGRGGLEGSIRKAADEALGMRNLQASQIEALRAAFIPAMVRVGADGARVRRRAYRNELPRGAEQVVQRLIDAWLLVTDRDLEGRETIEVTHEALLRVWPQLDVWLEEDQDKLRLLESVRSAAKEWHGGNHVPDLLVHRGDRLAEALALVREPRFALQPGSKASEYLQGCDEAQREREAAERKARERRIRDAERIAEAQRKAAQRTRIGLVVALVLAIGASIVGWIAKKNAAEAEAARDLAEKRQQYVVARQLETLSDKAFKEGHLEKSALLALESLRSKQTEEGLETLKAPLKRLLRPPEHIVPVPERSALRLFSIDATGRWLVLMSTTRGKRGGRRREIIRVHDLKQQIDVVTIERDDVSRKRIRVLAVSSDGRWVAGGGYDAGLVWDTRTGQKIKHLWLGEPTDEESAGEHASLTRALVKANEDLQGVLAFSPDSSKLYIATGDDAVHVYDTSTWRALPPFQHQHAPVLAVTTDLDGRYLITGSKNGLALWSAETRMRLATDIQEGANLSGLSVSPDRRFISARLRRRGTAGILIWRFPAVNEGRGADIELYAEWPHDPTGAGFDQALFSPSGQYLLVRTSYGKFELLGVPDVTGKESNANASVLRGAAWRRRIVNEFADAKYLGVTKGLFVVGVRAGVGFWRDYNNEDEERFIAYPAGLASIRFSPDGQWLASLSKDGGLRLYEGETLSPVALPSLPNPIRRFRFSPDAKWLAVGEGTLLRVFEVGSWRDVVPPIAITPGRGGRIALHFMENSRLFVLTATQALLVNPHKAAISPPFKHGLDIMDIKSIRVSPDGEWFATMQDARVNRRGDLTRPAETKIWAAATGREVSWESSRIAAASAWPDVISPPQSSGGSVKNERWRIWPGGVRGRATGILAYPLKLEGIVADACGRLSRNLTQKEWAQNMFNAHYRATCTNWRIKQQKSSF